LEDFEALIGGEGAVAEGAIEGEEVVKSGRRGGRRGSFLMFLLLGGYDRFDEWLLRAVFVAGRLFIVDALVPRRVGRWYEFGRR